MKDIFINLFRAKNAKEPLTGFSTQKRFFSSFIARGFTLIELLVVVVVITIILGIGIPSFNSINAGSSMKAAERAIQAGLMYARQESISRRQPVSFFVPTQIVQNNPYIRPEHLFAAYGLLAEETRGVALPTSIIGKIEPLPKGAVFTTSPIDLNSWRNIQLVDTNGVIFCQGRGIRYAPTGAIHWQDADALASAGRVSYPVIITEGYNLEGTIVYTRQGSAQRLTSTSQVNVITGRLIKNS
jgi:prepilin-type N-terminal cleavage/methylation domain-containing protein